jgi:pimeloyl-ACP methyl ester carboxylesterase
MTTEPVVLIHGIWVRGFVMRPLARALREAGFDPFIYSYSSTRLPLAERAQGLTEFVRACGLTQAHFVAHSMGGLLLRHLAAGQPELFQRAVTLCSPLHGSYLARRLHQRHLDWLLGRTWERGLDGNLPPWPQEIPLGSLAGNRPLGVGHLLARYHEANDGTVLVAETRLQQLADWRQLPHSHTGMLYADDAAEEVAHFLHQGCFSPG